MNNLSAAATDSGSAPDGALVGARIALLEGRMGEELAALVRRHGGVPLVAPAVREIYPDSSKTVTELIDRLVDERIDVVVFLTGAGADTLFAGADRLGREGELVQALKSATTICRGQKPRGALKRRGVECSLLVPEPYTTPDVLATLTALNPVDRGVAVVHYGELNLAISAMLRDLGSRVLDVCLYEWALPEDTEPLERMVETLVSGGVDAVAFTSQIQVRHLFEVAARIGRTMKLMQALNTRVVVAAVGPTCAAALTATGVTPRVVPKNPKMGPMIVALAEYLRSAGGRVPAPPT